MSWRFIISVIIASYETNSRFIAQKRLYILSLPPFPFHLCLFILLFLLMHLFPSTNLSPSTSAPFTFYSSSAPFLLLLQHLVSFYFSTFSPSTLTPYLLLLQTFSPSTSAPFLLLLQHLSYSSLAPVPSYCTVVQHLSSSITYNL